MPGLGVPTTVTDLSLAMLLSFSIQPRPYLLWIPGCQPSVCLSLVGFGTILPDSLDIKQLSSDISPLWGDNLVPTPGNGVEGGGWMRA